MSALTRCDQIEVQCNGKEKKTSLSWIRTFVVVSVFDAEHVAVSLAPLSSSNDLCDSQRCASTSNFPRAMGFRDVLKLQLYEVLYLWTQFRLGSNI